MAEFCDVREFGCARRLAIIGSAWMLPVLM